MHFPFFSCYIEGKWFLTLLLVKWRALKFLILFFTYTLLIYIYIFLLPRNAKSYFSTVDIHSLFPCAFQRYLKRGMIFHFVRRQSIFIVSVNSFSPLGSQNAVNKLDSCTLEVSAEIFRFLQTSFLRRIQSLNLVSKNVSWAIRSS